MSKLMSVLGIMLVAVGAALALVGFVNPAQMQVYGLTLDTAAILLTGGVLSVGLGGVIAALQNGVPAVAAASVAPATVEAVPPRETIVETPAVVAEPAPVAVVEAPKVEEDVPTRIRFPGFGRKTAAVATGLGAGVAAAAASAGDAAASVAAPVVPAGKTAVDDTIAALEQAKADIANAIGGVSDLSEPAKTEEVVEAVEDEEPEAAPVVEEGELYVIEEREIRGRPARVLSDNTVEAETDEGWMRFENLEHLNEYLDAMGEPA